MKNFKKAMKNFKKVRLSLGMKIIALLSCVALLSMGFASWWIIKVDDAPYATGSFVAYDVVTKNLHIGNVTTNNDGSTNAGKIVFGKPANLNNKTKWLVPQGQMDDEKLSAVLTFKVELKNEDNSTVDTETAVNSIVPTVDVTLAIPDTVAAAISAGYLTSPTLKYYIGQTVSADTTFSSSTVTGKKGEYDATNKNIVLQVPMTDAKGTVTVHLKFEFAWGTAFKPENESAGVNPFFYYNALEPTEGTSGNIAKAQTALGALEDCATTSTGEGDNITYTNAFTINFAANLGSN